MSVQMGHDSSPADDDAVALARKLVGDAHADWLEFLLQCDGCVPEPNGFDVGLKDGSGVAVFWSAAEAHSSQRKLADRMAPELLAIADAEGGNFVCLGLAKPAYGVFFWDHEVETTTRLCNSFAEFLGLL